VNVNAVAHGSGAGRITRRPEGEDGARRSAAGYYRD